MVGIELKIAGRASDASRVPRLRFGLVCVSGYRQAVPLVNELVMTPPRAELQCRTTTAVLPSLPCETRRMMPQWVRAGFVQMSPTLAFDSLQDDRPAIRSLIRMAQPASQMGPPPRIPFWCATQWRTPCPESCATGSASAHRARRSKTAATRVPVRASPPPAWSDSSRPRGPARGPGPGAKTKRRACGTFAGSNRIAAIIRSAPS